MNTAQIAALDIVIQHGNVPAIQALWASLSPIAVAGALGVADTSAAQPAAAAAAAVATPAAAAVATPTAKGKGKAAAPAAPKKAAGKKPKSEAIVLDADEEAPRPYDPADPSSHPLIAAAHAAATPPPPPKGKGKAKEAKPKGIAKKEKAPRAPRARTAYVLWSSRERQKIKDTRPVPVFESQADLLRELGRRWKALPEERKAKWHAKSAEEQRDIDAKKEAGASAEGEASGVEEEEE